jgi:very-short-patch-repair endonuclease
MMEELMSRARDARKQPTQAEEWLWKFLRRRQLMGARFRRQRPVGPYRVDFCCVSLNLVVEVDGPVHDLQVEADEGRLSFLLLQGFTVLRFSNEDVLRDTEQTVFLIKTHIEHLKTYNQT